MRTALVHDWLIEFAGAEKVLEGIYATIKAPVHTLFLDRSSLEDTLLRDAEINTSFLQNFPGLKKFYKHLLPFYPKAIESFDLADYDLIISSSHAVAKGVKTNKNQIHICYCHTPMRYAWDVYSEYLNSMSYFEKLPFQLTVSWLKKWDIKNSKKVDHFIANSKFIADRIQRIYQRKSQVVYPPVDTNFFDLGQQKDDYYLFVGRLANVYKRVDLAIDAFNSLKKPLVIIGEGPDAEKLKTNAKNNIEFLGRLSKNNVKAYMQNAKALIFPSLDDFGIVPVEAQACGTPVIAYRGGGALETVVENKTGTFFNKQTKHNLAKAVLDFEKIEHKFEPKLIRKNAEQFSKENFVKKFKNKIIKYKKII